MTRRFVPLLLISAAVAAIAQEAPNSAPTTSNPRVDFGIVVTDIEKALAFYTDVLGLKETGQLAVPGKLGEAIGLSDNLPFTVHVLQFGDGSNATHVKLMEFSGTRPSRPDNSYLHSTYGIRYLTFYVDDLDASLKHAAEWGVKPIAQGAQMLPKEIVPGVGIAVVRDPDGNFIELVGPMQEG